MPFDVCSKVYGVYHVIKRHPGFSAKLASEVTAHFSPGEVEQVGRDGFPQAGLTTITPGCLSSKFNLSWGRSIQDNTQISQCSDGVNDEHISSIVLA